MTWSGLFGTKSDISWWQECDRAVLIFIYGLALVRIAGRRAFGKWAALDIIVSVMVGSNLSRALTGTAAVGGTLIATTLLMVLHWILANIAARSKWFADLVEGSPIQLARDGKPQRSTLIRQSISDRDIEEALRQSGIDALQEARLIMLEPSGKITVLKRKG
jgi:uncharacterized membrane protein YcaP (DUF421 family)